MTLQFRPSDKALIKHDSSTNPNQVGKLMSECCCAADSYVEFMSCGTHIASTFANCSTADRAYHSSLCANADSFGQDCCQVGIGQCASFTGNDKQSPAEAYENNCDTTSEQQIGGSHTVNGVVKTEKRHCAAVYMRLEDFKQMPIGSGGPTMSQLGWLPPAAGGTTWPIVFKIGGHCFVGSGDIRSESQIKQTTDSSGTTIPACKKINAGSFNEDCAGDIMAYTGSGLAISPGQLDFSTDQTSHIRNLCGNCCSAVWTNTTDCSPCPGFSDDNTSPEGGCIQPLDDTHQIISFEFAKGFAHCDCIDLGTSPTTQDFTNKVQGFNFGSNTTNCKQTQCQIVGGGEDISDPSNARIGGCPGMLSYSGTHPCQLPVQPGIFGNSFFLGGDIMGLAFNCTGPSCKGSPNPGPFETCEECLCRTPQCSCACMDCPDGDCDFASCGTSYTVNTPSLTVTTSYFGSSVTLDIGSTGVSVTALGGGGPTCKAGPFVPCADGTVGFDPCFESPQNNQACPFGYVIHAGPTVKLISDPDPEREVYGRLIVNTVKLICSLPTADPSSPCASLPNGNNFGVSIGFTLGLCEGTSGGSPCTPGEFSTGQASDFVATYVSSLATDDCPPGTYTYCQNDSGDPYNSSVTFDSTITVS